MPISNAGFKRIAQAVLPTAKKPAKATRKQSRDFNSNSPEELSRYFQGTTLHSVTGDTDILLDDSDVYVGIVHDGSGYTPLSCAFITQERYGGSLDGALQEAYGELETYQRDKMTPEELQEMYDTEENEGYNSLTESYDGMGFTVTGIELQQAVQSANVKALSVITFEAPEVDEPEEDF
jgi:hypothetical protein